MKKPDGFDKWNPALRAAYCKGHGAALAGLSRGDCPYIDRRKSCGRITWSRGFIAAWRDGYDAGELDR